MNEKPPAGTIARAEYNHRKWERRKATYPILRTPGKIVDFLMDKIIVILVLLASFFIITGLMDPSDSPSRNDSCIVEYTPTGIECW